MAKSVAKGRWVSHNQNPRGIKTGDCVIRAFSFVTGKTWERTLLDLTEVSVEVASVPNNIDTYSVYAQRIGLIKKPVIVTKGKSRLTVTGFASENPKGTFILRVANHVVAVKDGYYYDTWDCGRKCVYTYWQVPEGGVK